MQCNVSFLFIANTYLLTYLLSLLPKIDEVNLIANKSNATILGISETKLVNTIMDSELKIEGYDLIRSDRNRHGDGVACYIKKDRHYNVRENCPKNFENIFLDLLLPNSKPILIGILYKPPDQSVFFGHGIVCNCRYGRL